MPEAVQSAAIDRLRGQYAELAAKEADLRTNLGERHPFIAAVRTQMQDVRRLIDAELNRIAGAAETEYQRAQSNERTLTAELERLQRQSASTAKSSVQLRELEREVEASRSVYNNFLVRAREIKEQTSIDSSNARIITAARPPQDPSWPPRLILIAAALAGGLGLGAGLALTREYLAPTVLSPRQLEWIANAPVVAIIPGLRPRGANAAAASFTLDHLAATSSSAGSSLALLVTSGESDEAERRAVIRLLASVAVGRGDRVLLVDADLRSDGSSAGGLLDVLRGEQSLNAVIQTDTKSGARRIGLGDTEKPLRDALTPDNIDAVPRRRERTVRAGDPRRRRAHGKPAARPAGDRRGPVAAGRLQRGHAPARPHRAGRYVGGPGSADLGLPAAAEAQRVRTVRQPALGYRYGTRQRSGGLARAVARVESLAYVLWVLVLVGISGGLLWALGINYDGISGSAPSKIHPATYLAVVLVGWTLMRAGNPVIPVAQALNRRPACVLLAVCGVLLLVLIAARGGTGLAGSIDTFVLAGLVPILLLDRDPVTLGRLESVFHGVMLANALLGLFELASGQRFFPFRFDGMAFETDTRSAALQGHPLANATMTACYVLALARGGGRLGPGSRAGMITLQLVALVTFGGRSATVTTLVLGTGVGLAALNRTLRGGRVPLVRGRLRVLRPDDSAGRRGRSGRCGLL